MSASGRGRRRAVVPRRPRRCVRRTATVARRAEGGREPDASRALPEDYQAWGRLAVKGTGWPPLLLFDTELVRARRRTI
jgi:hypothetical protein